MGTERLRQKGSQARFGLETCRVGGGGAAGPLPFGRRAHRVRAWLLCCVLHLNSLICLLVSCCFICPLGWLPDAEGSQEPFRVPHSLCFEDGHPDIVSKSGEDTSSPCTRHVV